VKPVLLLKLLQAQAKKDIYRSRHHDMQNYKKIFRKQYGSPKTSSLTKSHWWCIKLVLEISSLTAIISIFKNWWSKAS